MKFECTNKEWNEFVKEVKWADDDSPNNFKEDFKKLSNRWGKAYLSYLEAAYLARSEMSDATFCEINGNVPVSFLEKYLK